MLQFNLIKWVETRGKYLLHKWSTNPNEAFNGFISNFVPKNKNFPKSYIGRVTLAVFLWNYGYIKLQSLFANFEKPLSKELCFILEKKTNETQKET